jgi:hypothetical protein
MRNESDDWLDPEAIEAECDHCHETRPVLRLPDPYVKELYPDDDAENSWWCRPCYSARANDI